MKGYWVIIGTDVTDQNAQAEYGRLWKPIAEKYQAVINPSDTPPALKESRDAARLLIVEFPSYELATACYEDPAYQEARQYALKAAQRELLIFKGDLA
ncbi:DUF1330 domain-containing protein [Serratia marcescens]|uniref:DUF1330 domain-containing protein n=1 Tax=Serratia marcescens TaxID=615 RepID=UPI0015616094|nr:DUF1330 domain-containing protein [Serratia marcescens]MBH2591044.1 DUF1330 domain-containing protein [Serratia marcescens]NRN18454.1 DUF1330 domain-containing protein [Serratia marcescens]NRN21978.1 DUF1330 domain-containing protein [Serratia marcescens]NRN55901.1 DUF1330 domain-containing protein [Serratia marcescens]NSM13120.1 DUF1330 domain-containing protein [Serratia marcescens]